MVCRSIIGLHDRTHYEDNAAGAVITVGRILFGYDGAYAGILLIDLDPFSLLRLDHEFVQARDKQYLQVDESADNIILTGNTTPNHLFVKTEIPRSKLLHKINQIKGVTVTVILLSCLVITLISFGLSYTITKPIKALRRSMKICLSSMFECLTR